MKKEIFDNAFFKGFYICSASYKSAFLNDRLFEKWSMIHLGEFLVNVAPEAEYIRVSFRKPGVEDDAEALIIGDVFVAHTTLTVGECLYDFLINGNWEAIDYLSGRFVIVYKDKFTYKIIQDPFGSRTLYYSIINGVCASHAALCAYITDEKISSQLKHFKSCEEYKLRGNGFLPGNLTMYQNIKSLIPNHVLDIASGEVKRFWPRENVKKVSYEEFLSLVDEYFFSFSTYLEKKYLPVLGLTGGVDSRAVIAGLKSNVSELELVTWTGKGRVNNNELGKIEHMKSHLQLPHKYLPISDRVDEEYLNLLQATNVSTGYCRGRSKLSLSMCAVAAKDKVFVRGYGGEIIRGFFNRSKFERGERLSTRCTAEDFALMYLGKKVKSPSEEFYKWVVDIFEDFFENEEYSDLDESYDLMDIFYWEHRMGTWAANKLNEMDFIMYGLVGINSRKIFLSAFGLDVDKRLNEEIMLDICRMYDEKLAQIGRVS